MILLAVVRHIPGSWGYFAMSQHACLLFCRNFSLYHCWTHRLCCPAPLGGFLETGGDPRGDRRDPRGAKPSPALPLPREALRSRDHAGFALPPQH